MLWLLIWLVYGLLVGFVAKMIYPGDDPKGILPTLAIGIGGSYMGGLINWVVGRADAFSYTGALMGLVGAIICCWIYDKFRLHRVMEMQQRQIFQLEDEARTLRMNLHEFHIKEDK